MFERKLRFIKVIHVLLIMLVLGNSCFAFKNVRVSCKMINWLFTISTISGFAIQNNSTCN